MSLEKLVKYRGIAAASQYAGDKNALGVKYSLKKLGGEIDLGKDGEVLYSNSLKSEQGMAGIMQAYGGAYEDAAKNVTVGEMFNEYSTKMSRYFKDETWVRASEEYANVANMSYDTLKKKVAQAQYKMADKSGLFDEGAKKVAKEEMEEFMKYTIPLQNAEQDELIEWKKDVEEDILKEMYEHLWAEQQNTAA
jgi:hypothetical protein